MNRNSALFGASVAAAVAGATGLVVATGSPSYAAPGDKAYGVAYADPFGSSGWTTGAVTSGYGLFAASASAAGGVAQVAFRTGLGSPVSVRTSCVAGQAQVTVTGGGAAGTYTSPTSVSLAKFVNASTLVGSVSLLTKSGDVTIGASVDFSPGVAGSYVRLGGVRCAAVTTSTTTAPTSTTSTSTTTAPTSTTSTSTTTAPTSTTTTSTTTAPTSTTTTSTTTAPTSTTTTSTTTAPTSTTTSSTTGPPIVTDGPTGVDGDSTPWLPIGGLGLALLGAGVFFVNVIRTRQE